MKPVSPVRVAYQVSVLFRIHVELVLVTQTIVRMRDNRLVWEDLFG